MEDPLKREQEQERLLKESPAISCADKVVYDFAQVAEHQHGNTHGVHLSVHGEMFGGRINVFLIERDAKRLAAFLCQAYPDVTREIEEPPKQ